MPPTLPRIGLGWDVHRLVADRPLRLAGVSLPYSKGLLGHSDGDVVLHAVIDAMLGGAGLDDIGQMFPASDPAFKNADSTTLLAAARSAVERAGWRVVQVDTVVVLEEPRLAAHKQRLRESLAGLLDLAVAEVNVKAKTAEGLGAIGRCEAIACYAVAVLVPSKRKVKRSGQ